MNKKLVGLIAGTALAAVATLVGVKTVKGKNGEVIEEVSEEVEETPEEI